MLSMRVDLLWINGLIFLPLLHLATGCGLFWEGQNSGAETDPERADCWSCLLIALLTAVSEIRLTHVGFSTALRYLG